MFLSKVKKTFCWVKNKAFEARNVRNFIMHFWDYPWIWIALGLILYSAYQIAPVNWEVTKLRVYFAFVILLAVFLFKPMNAVYGLMGSSGSIRIFFFNFILISVVFAGIYYLGAFRYAGISYDINQPHIDFNMFMNTEKKDSIHISEKKDTLFLEHQYEGKSVHEKLIHTTLDTLHYQEIDFWQVWRSTILTTLTQQPSELFAIASVHNAAVESGNAALDQEESDLFEWILIFHVIISWIFFGVFISLLYNKFRYES